MNPLLLPGTHLLRRDAGTLQAGLHAGVRLPDGTFEQHLPRLVRSGAALADDRPLRTALPRDGVSSPWPRHALAALARRTGERLPAALHQRSRCCIEVETFGHPVARELAGDLRALLSRAGVGDGAGRVSAGHRLRVLAGVGEPRRELLDPLTRAGTPYLLLRLVEGSALVGPFVVPGETACLRCLDAYHTERDPAWPLLVEQYARASERDRADGVPEPLDAALAAVAVAWAARDAMTYAEGERPSTWSSTIRLPPRLDGVEVQPWPVHPHCGCGWP